MKARIGAGFMIWLAAVVSVAGIAWLAIGTAGRQVTADPIAAPLPTEFPPSPSPTRTTVPRTTGNNTTSSGDGENQAPVASSTPRRSVDPAAVPSSSRPWHSDRSRPRFTPVTSTYSTPAGRLRVRCEGQEITLDGGYAQPAPGWGVTVQSGGPERIQVTFDTPKTEPVTVVAECGQGKPRFHTSATPESVPTTEGGWRFQAQQRTPTPAPPTTEPAATPTCGVSPSPSDVVVVVPTVTVSATETVTPTPEATPPACPEVTPTATMSPEESPQEWTESWSQREWALSTRR